MLYLLHWITGSNRGRRRQFVTRCGCHVPDCSFFLLPGHRHDVAEGHRVRPDGCEVKRIGRHIPEGAVAWYHAISDAPFATGNARLLGKPTSPVTDKTTPAFIERRVHIAPYLPDFQLSNAQGFRQLSARSRLRWLCSTTFPKRRIALE